MDLSDLNPQQHTAVVDSLDTNSVVIAGAGSGKTRVLTARTGYLLDDMNVSPENIMAVTFTNKAAAELTDRLASVTPDVRKMWVGTFHSICVRILRKFGIELGIKNFTIMDTYDAKGALKDVLVNMNIPLEKATINKYMNKISGCKNNLINPAKMLSTAKNDSELQFAIVYQAYQDIKWRRKSFDFDDLIIYTVTLLTRCGSVRQWFWDNIPYVMIDESQDTNSSQFELITLLAGTNNLFLVGDDYQSIYSFRNAKPEYLLNFKDIYPNGKILFLEENYRSTQTIVNASLAVIKNNEKQYEKNTFSAKAIGDPILYHTASDAVSEGNWIATEIQLINSQGIDYKDIAILYRTNSQSRALEESFMKFGIPHKLVGGLRFYDRKEIKDTLAFLRLRANPQDEVSFKRSFGSMKGFGKKSVEEVCNYVTVTGKDYITAMAEYPAPKRLQHGIGKLIHLYSFGSATPSEFIDEVISQTGYMQELVDEDTPESKARIENLKELINIAKESEEQEPNMSIEDFINKVSLASVTDKDSGEGNVTLMTVHASKGLEFRIVFVVGAEEGLLPHGNAIGTPSAIEEERRLMYVAMTRAKELLYITNALSRRDFGGNVSTNKPSRFVREIPDKYLCAI